MRNPVIHILFFLLLMFAFSSCINEIEFDESQSAPMLTLNCLTTPDTILKVNLYKSRFFLSTSSTFETITDHTMRLFVNGVLKESLTVKNNQYQSKYKPKAGDNLMLEVLKPSGGGMAVFASSQIPQKPVLLKTDTSSVYQSISYLVNDSARNQLGQLYKDTLARLINRRFYYKIQLRDSLALENFYRIKIFLYHYYADGKVSKENLRIRPDDIAFDKKNESDVFDNDWDRIFNIFNDVLFDGKTYTIGVFGNLNVVDILPDKKNILVIGGYKFPVKSELVIDLQAIDYGMFQYLKTVKYNNTDLQYFSEPVQVHSNVYGGTGLFGSYTHALTVIPLVVGGNRYISR